MTIVLRILLKLTHYSFFTDRVLSSTFLETVCIMAPRHHPSVETVLLSAPPLNLPDQVPKPNSPLPVENHPEKTQVFTS